MKNDSAGYSVSFIRAHCINSSGFWNQSIKTAVLLLLSVLSFITGLYGIVCALKLEQRVEGSVVLCGEASGFCNCTSL